MQLTINSNVTHCFVLQFVKPMQLSASSCLAEKLFWVAMGSSIILFKQIRICLHSFEHSMIISKDRSDTFKQTQTKLPQSLSMKFRSKSACYSSRGEGGGNIPFLCVSISSMYFIRNPAFLKTKFNVLLNFTSTLSLIYL